MKTNSEFGLFIIIAAIAGLISVGINFRNTQVQEHTICSIDKVEKVEGDQDHFSTSVYYLVTTDKGAYKVKDRGFNAAPQCAALQKDSTYILTTRGTSIPFFNMYENIINYQIKK